MGKPQETRSEEERTADLERAHSAIRVLCIAIEDFIAKSENWETKPVSYDEMVKRNPVAKALRKVGIIDQGPFRPGAGVLKMFTLSLRPKLWNADFVVGGLCKYASIAEAYIVLTAMVEWYSMWITRHEFPVINMNVDDLLVPKYAPMCISLVQDLRQLFTGPLMLADAKIILEMGMAHQKPKFDITPIYSPPLLVKDIVSLYKQAKAPGGSTRSITKKLGTDLPTSPDSGRGNHRVDVRYFPPEVHKVARHKYPNWPEIPRATGNE